MEKFKGTPGPWKVRFMNNGQEDSDFFVEAKNNNRPDLGYGIEILGDDYGDHNGYTHEQRLADASLIAAAPELLEALQRFVTFVDKQNLIYESSMVREAKSAIRKALNQQP